MSLLTSVWAIEGVHWSPWVAYWDLIHILAFLWIIPLLYVFYLRSFPCLFLGFLCCIIRKLNKWIIIALASGCRSLILWALKPSLDTRLGLVHAVAFLVLLKIIGLVHILNRLANHSSYYSFVLLFYIIYIYITL